MKILILLLMLLISSCSDLSVQSYKNELPKLNLKEFFNGDIYAQGIVQDRSGQIIKRFKVDIKASWIGNKAILDEKFSYSDQTKSTRVWELKELGENKYQGKAGDVEGVALGEVAGNAFYFEYVLNLPIGEKTYKVTFKDWMFLLDQNTLLARSYMKKWGINLGEVTIVMNKKVLK